MTGPRLDHGDIEGLLAAAALGELEEPDATRLADLRAEHGAECEICEELEHAYTAVAVELALSLPSRPVSPVAGDRLMAAVLTTAPAGTSPTSEVAELSRPGRILPRPASSRGRILAAAAALALLVAGGAIGYAVHQPPEGTSSAAAQITRLLSEPGTRLASFPSNGDVQLAVAYRPGHPDGWVIGSGLPDPAGTKVYELWFRRSGTSRMQPAGTFAPSGHGIIRTAVTVGKNFDLLAVSVEPAGGSKQPTTAPILQLKV